MKYNEKVLVLCIDKDDDFGEKAHVHGPVVGRKECLDAASKLGVADATDSDVNCLFAAISEYDKLRKEVSEVEIALVTGDPSRGFKADRQVGKQLDEVLADFDADGVLLVTDGADDATLTPLIRSKIPIFSTKMVIVKQAKELEKTYTVIKQGLKDPTIAKLALGFPGILLLLYFTIGFESIRIMMGLVGFYLILKGFGIEDWLINGSKDFIRTVSFQRLSFPFYLATLVFLMFMSLSAYGNFINEANQGPVRQVAIAVQQSVSFLAFAGLSFVLGKIIDSHYLMKAHKLRSYLVVFASVMIAWYVVESALGVVLGNLSLSDLLISVVISAVGFIAATKMTKIFEVHLKPTKDLIGKTIYSSRGQLLGTVIAIDKKRGNVVMRPPKGRRRNVSTDDLSPRIEGLVKLT